MGMMYVRKRGGRLEWRPCCKRYGRPRGPKAGKRERRGLWSIGGSGVSTEAEARVT